MDARAGENDTQTKLNRRKEAIKKTIRNQNHFHPKNRAIISQSNDYSRRTRRKAIRRVEAIWS